MRMREIRGNFMCFSTVYFLFKEVKKDGERVKENSLDSASCFFLLFARSLIPQFLRD